MPHTTSSGGPADTEIYEAVKAALQEDVGTGDATTLSTIPEQLQAKAHFVAREPLVVCGLAFACSAFAQCDSSLITRQLAQDSDAVPAGAVLLEIEGTARAILTAERTALNFAQHLSGIATLTSQFVNAIKGSGAVILDTRKTTPGWRTFEKYAVRCGGGTNHRLGLFDRILIKDNHRVALSNEPEGPIAAAVKRSRARYPGLLVEVEADTLDEVQQAIEAGADIILLDNMTPAVLREAVTMTKGRAKLEASGGVRLDTVREIALTGVDFISVGALTHSARSVDLALDFIPSLEDYRTEFRTSKQS